MKQNHNHADLWACGKLLIQQQLTIAFAESATAGRIAAEFALIPDAGKFLKGGLICYDADLKCNLLKVPRAQLDIFTPESAVVTQAITTGLQNLIPADIHIGCTGLTSSGGSESPEKPVGTMFLYAARAEQQLFNERLVFQGSPEHIVLQTIGFLANRLHHYLEQHSIS